MTTDLPETIPPEPMTTIPTAKLEQLMKRLELDSGIIDLLPDAVVVVSEDGSIIRTNAQATALFGYRPEEFATLRVEALMAPDVRAQHAQHRLGYQAAPGRIRMAPGRVLAARRRDGTEVEVEIMLNSFRAASGQLTIAVVRSR